MYEVVPKTGLQLRILQAMYTESKTDGTDFWIPARGINIPVQISIPPGSKLAATFRLMGMSVKLKMDNVQRYIDQQNKVNLKFTPKGEAADFNYGEYHDLAAVSVKLYERNLGLGLGPLSTIFQLYRVGQLYS